MDSILTHASRIYGDRQIHTRLPNGATHTYTYADLRRRATKLASALSKRGIQIGE